jgi:uncharacterized protein (DUF362 family)
MTSPITIPVCLDQCHSYTHESLYPILQKHLDVLQVPANCSGKKILLKPNLISASAPPLACSCPEFVAVVANCFLDRGATLFLGDSPAFGSAKQVLKKHGFVRALSGLDVSLIEFQTKVVRKLDCGLSVTVAAEALDCDYFINVPRVKAHQQMGVTMAVKNVFGIILGARKAWLHMTHGETHNGFAELILDLGKLLPPTIAIADGITVMNRMGPLKGSPLSLACVALSRNFVALDRAMLEVLGLDKKKIPLAMEAEKQGLPGAILEEIEFPALHPDAFTQSGFRIARQLNPIRFQFLQYFRSSLKRILAS